MAATAPTRRRAAEIVVTGVAESGTAATFLRAELDGVRYASFSRYDAPALDAAFDGADMLIFVAGPGDAVNATRTHAVAAYARERGILVAALVVEAGASGGVLPAVRDAADMVVIVRDASALPAVVAALR